MTSECEYVNRPIVSEKMLTKFEPLTNKDKTINPHMNKSIENIQLCMLKRDKK